MLCCHARWSSSGEQLLTPNLFHYCRILHFLSGHTLSLHCPTFLPTQKPKMWPPAAQALPAVRGQVDAHDEAALELARLNVSRDNAYLQQAKKRAGGGAPLGVVR